ncbi:transposase domain-containing protein, partial [Sinorhizobium meliloti]|uniref:transposase domain-containing protein n=1 Tax=Rhizobium meliloti TaxID=382 RepID=UPI001F454546
TNRFTVHLRQIATTYLVILIVAPSHPNCRAIGGGRTWATVATLLQTCKMNGVDPLDWLSQTLTRIAQGWPASEIEALMPWNFRSDAVS